MFTAYMVLINDSERVTLDCRDKEYGIDIMLAYWYPSIGVSIYMCAGRVLVGLRAYLCVCNVVDFLYMVHVFPIILADCYGPGNCTMQQAVWSIDVKS